MTTAVHSGGPYRRLGVFLVFVLREFPLARLAIASTLLILVLEYASLSIMIPLAAGTTTSGPSGGGQAVTRLWMSAVQAVGLTPALMTWVWLFLVFLGLRTLAGYLHLLLTTFLAKQVHRRLSEAVFARVLIHEPMASIYRRSIGFYISLAGDDTFRAGTLVNSVLQVLSGMVSAAAGLVLLYLFSPTVFAATLAFLVLSAAIIGLCVVRMLKLNADSVALSREAGTGFLEALNSLRSIRSMAAEHFVLSTYARQMRAYTLLLFQVESLRSSIRFVPGIIALVCGVAVLGPWNHSLAAASAGAIFATTTILIRVFVSLGALMTASSAFLIDARAAKDLGSLAAFGRPPGTDAAGNAAGPAAAKLTRIDVVRLSHHYTPDRKIIDELTFSFERGRCYAVVGPSGAGKSTLADVVLGMVEPTSGQLLVDGLPVEASALRRRTILVEQQPKIFSATLRDNLLLGLDRADSELLDALEKVSLADFVEALPKGLSTVLEYQGANLSGGQRQRLSIARALIRHPEVLILDEATSALDAETRDRVVARVRVEMKDAVLIFITHDGAISGAVDTVLELAPTLPDRSPGTSATFASAVAA